ncbi:MAG TPA: aminotransferase class I/II-fold pyridoxal phosphate-dependent enzyme [Planctomycetota bacterium]|nr:aminotransferase class I/II-fold pyridoxal phosphate-dependent enzyme [Planctomycetota bacterium]
MDLFEKLQSAPNLLRAQGLRDVGLYQFFRAISDSDQGTHVTVHGRRLVMAGSNNYLGLTHHPVVMEAARAAITKFGTGCTGSRFLNGTLELHEELEARLAKFLGRDACITSGTGFQTNVGALGALALRGDVIFGDRDNHASLIDGCRLAFGKLVKYRHNDVDDLERLLKETPCDGGRLIVTDGVFSMLGDLAPLPGIVALARRHEARLLVDDAHAIGVLGAHGRGTPEHFGVEAETDLVVGTFSKSFACLGGFVAGPAGMIDYLKHASRSVVFSASMPPSNVATVLACLDVVEREPERRERLWANVRRMKAGFDDLGFEVIDHGSPILSIMVGTDEATFEFNRRLFEEGVFVNPVVPPAVPEGQSLLRTSYMATHTEEDLDTILRAFRRVGERLRILG